MHQILGHRYALIVVLAAAVVARVAVLSMKSETVSEDRDAYLAIAASLADGNGYTHPATDQPTAYRPPLYPIVCAALFAMGGGTTAIAILHFVCGMTTVVLTWSIGRRIGNAAIGGLAAGLVAIDPLLVGYTAISMTETVFTFLVTLLIAIFVGCTGCGERVMDARTMKAATGQRPMRLSPDRRRQIVIGVVFGLCAMCRPTIWAFGILMTIVWFIVRLRRRDARIEKRWPPWLLIVAVLLTVSPWIIRNAIVLGRPVVMTTHGGYTLLLGNNPVFYREVVSQPWRTVWDDAPTEFSQSAWYSNLESKMNQQLGTAANEIQRDRWMNQTAIMNIRKQPGMFIRACWLRIRRFWNVAPSRPIAASLPRPVEWGIVVFYSAILIGLLLGFVRIVRNKLSNWIPLCVLVLGFMLVHSVYWSNMRMRAPVIPEIAMMCSLGLLGLRPSRDD